MSKLRLAACGLASAATILALVPVADSACCYFSAKDADINQPAQKAFLTYDPTESVETFTVQPKFEGNALDFGMVIPTPARPKLDEMPLDLRKAYLATAPHPEQLPSFFAKSVQRMREFKGWTPAQLQTIRAPTLLVLGDRDIVRVEHAVQMQHLLPDARLAVLPATDHLVMPDRAADVASMLDEFLLRGVNASRSSGR